MNLTEEILIPDSLDAIDKRLEGLTPEDALLELTDWLADYEKHRQEAQDLLEVIETDFTFQDLKKVVFGADKDLLNWYWVI
jgi:hypothetical protein